MRSSYKCSFKYTEGIFKPIEVDYDSRAGKPFSWDDGFLPKYYEADQFIDLVFDGKIIFQRKSQIRFIRDFFVSIGDLL